MKKILIIGLSVALTAMIFYSCSLVKSLNEVQQNGFICSNYDAAPVNKMNKQDVLDMISNYYQKQYNAIGNSNMKVDFPITNSIDSRAVFFSLDTLKRLLYYVEKATKNFSASDKENLGINIYFASYPEAMQMHKNGYDYLNRHTLIFIPSIFDNTKQIAKDFDISNSLNGINTIAPLYIDSAYLITPSITSIAGMYSRTATSIGGGSSMNVQNHGTGTPPPPTAPTGNPILDLTDPN